MALVGSFDVKWRGQTTLKRVSVNQFMGSLPRDEMLFRRPAYLAISAVRSAIVEPLPLRDRYLRVASSLPRLSET